MTSNQSKISAKYYAKTAQYQSAKRDGMGLVVTGVIVLGVLVAVLYVAFQFAM